MNMIMMQYVNIPFQILMTFYRSCLRCQLLDYRKFANFFSFEIVLTDLFLYQAPIFFEKDPTVTQQQKDQVSSYMKVLDAFLAKTPWLAGDKPTLADLSVLASVSQICACFYDLSQHPNLSRWWSNCKKLPGFDECVTNASKVGAFYKSKFPE